MKDFDVLYKFYDAYNGADFKGFFDFYKSAVLKYAKSSPEIVLDLGCGTGELSSLLSREYQTIGIDISSEMLSVAFEKCDGKVLLLNQDMRDFELYGTIQGCVSFCDCFNYLETNDDLKKAFSRVALFLEEGGIFAFDSSTEHRFKNILHNFSFVNETEDGMLIHQGEYSEKEKNIKMYVTVFEKQGDLYQRFDEIQYEYFHSDEEYIKIAEEAGFELCGIYGDLNFNDITPTDEKHYYIFRRKKWVN